MDEIYILLSVRQTRENCKTKLKNLQSKLLDEQTKHNSAREIWTGFGQLLELSAKIRQMEEIIEKLEVVLIEIENYLKIIPFNCWTNVNF